MVDGVCVQTSDARIVQVNRAFAEMIGLPAEQLIGRPSAEIFSCHYERSEHNLPCARLISKVTQHRSHNERSGHHPGQRLRARISPLHDDAGQLGGSVMVVRDDTAIALREREQARTEQIARLGELVAGLAHEIKNPLAGIQGAVDILIQRRPADDPERKVLEDVRQEVVRIDEALKALLNRARPRSFNFQVASLTETVQRAVGLGQAIASMATHGRVRVELLAPDTPIMLPLDTGQVEDAVLNLILNGLDAIEGPGHILVQVLDNHLEQAQAPYATVFVSDTGRGIPPEDLQRIFNPFFTTNPEGPGLGLSAVRRILRAHGGRVEVASTQGTGTTFKLSLPYQRDSAEPPLA
jgi:PAS domain S-box-containing protein